MTKRIRTTVTMLELPQDTAKDVLKRLSWASPLYLEAVLVEVSYYITSSSPQTQTTPYEPSEVEVTNATWIGFEEGELFLPLSEKQGTLVDSLVGLEEGIELACREHKEKEGI